MRDKRGGSILGLYGECYGQWFAKLGVMTVAIAPALGQTCR